MPTQKKNRKLNSNLVGKVLNNILHNTHQTEKDTWSKNNAESFGDTSSSMSAKSTPGKVLSPGEHFKRGQPGYRNR